MNEPKRGEWQTWWDAESHYVVGWMPWDDREPPSHIIRFDNPRDAHIAQEVLVALDARPYTPDPHPKHPPVARA